MWLAAALAACAALVGGCAQPQRSTRMTAYDLTEMSIAMAQSLQESEVIARRSPDSPRWVVSIDKVQNLSNDVMTDAEQWFVVQRLRSSLPMQALADERNIVFVIPAERARLLRDELGAQVDEPGFAAGRHVTHQMTATFRSLTRALATQQTESYYAEFEIMDLAAGEPVWTDRFEFKRSAKGHVWD